ncbi:hypothetical protein OC842_002106 [Tilletia horrida]|uniref:WD40 repeat-like protein n=1 Tax=Tilletia horrida TaxID=155126 RepID=A0AAN6GGJ5_9BASI|nr:hypothetical protein OC842_002106 [Tilletia horrida]
MSSAQDSRRSSRRGSRSAGATASSNSNSNSNSAEASTARVRNAHAILGLDDDDDAEDENEDGQQDGHDGDDAEEDGAGDFLDADDGMREEYDDEFSYRRHGNNRNQTGDENDGDEEEDGDEDYYAAEVDLDDAFGDEDEEDDMLDEDADDGDDIDLQEYISRVTAGQGSEDDEDETGEVQQGEGDVEMGEGSAGPAAGQQGSSAQEMGLLELLVSLTQSSGGTGLSTVALRALREYASNNNIQIRTVRATDRATERRELADEDIDDEDDDEDDDDYVDDDEFEDEQPRGWSYMANQARPKISDRWEKVTEPVPAGQELLMSGDFGSTPQRPLDAPRSNFAPSRNLYGILDSRRTSTRPLPKTQLAHYVPNTAGVEVARYEDPCYCGQYSEDSTFFYSCTQDFRVHMYDTTVSAPPSQSIRRHGFGGRHWATASQQTTLRPIKSIRARQGQWTITDANLSPDNRFMIYSSITPYVHLVPTGLGDEGEELPAEGAGAIRDEDVVDPENPAHSARQVQLDFSAPGGRTGWYDSGALWSIRFSGDSREIVGGAGNGSIAVYDIEARRQTLRVSGHEEDVNAVAFADRGSGNVLISGSDDSYVKIWDRRSLYHGRPAGVLVGHTEGVTYVSPKGDGRYCVSNGKDQCAKLWDLRQMHSGSEYSRLSRLDYGINGFDYRAGTYARPRYETRPDDCSLMTFRGHAVLRTLIRCHFSPQATTGQKYIYSGSADGFIHIWSLDGRVVQVIDRSKALPLAADPVAGAAAPSASDFDLVTDGFAATSEELTSDGFEGRYRPRYGTPRSVSTCVRDVSWHSAEPSMMSTAWDGASRSRGSIAKHEWKDFGKRGLSLEDALEKARQEAR